MPYGECYNKMNYCYKKEKTMDNTEMTEKLRSIAESVNSGLKDSVLGMIEPRFVSYDPEEGSVTMEFPALEWEKNRYGIMQGGIVATMLDFSGVFAATTCFDNPVTVSLQVSYLRACKIGGTMVCRVLITKPGRSVVHTFARLWEKSAPDKLIATANTVYHAP